MQVLSLFDGMSCGMLALERAGLNVRRYYASEIDEAAIKVSACNYPDIIRVGDVTKISYDNGVLHTDNGDFPVGQIDLLIGGSPCQDFSAAGTLAGKPPQGLAGNKSRLFYEYLRIKKEVNPTFFLLENVLMTQASKLMLDAYLGTSGVEINSALLSYQNRRRMYWANFPFDLPNDAGISFQDYKETDPEIYLRYKAEKTGSRIAMWNNGNGRTPNSRSCSNITHSDKVHCLTTKQDRSPNSGLIECEDFFRYLTQAELEQAQTVPVGYTDCVSYAQACKVLGNGWTVSVIAHILKHLPTT